MNEQIARTYEALKAYALPDGYQISVGEGNEDTLILCCTGPSKGVLAGLIIHPKDEFRFLESTVERVLTTCFQAHFPWRIG